MDALRSIDFLKDCSEISPIHEGYSEDQKFLVVKDRERFLLRTFKIKELAAKEEEFTSLHRMRELGVRCSRPLEIGALKDGELGYLLLTFIDGLDGSKALPSLPTSDQYRIGTEAGQELKKIHLLEAPSGIAPWHERRLDKYERYLSNLRAWGIEIKRGREMVKFIEAHLSLMKDRPNLFQHDDYHPKNLVIQDQALAGVIDFGRHDWGDPVHEFLKLGQFGSEISIPFSVGQIRGYFDGRDPDEDFWKLYSLYSAMALISSITWTRYVCPDEMPATIGMIERVMDDHDAFERIVPKWYAKYAQADPS